jgi:hypothetical protein
MSLLGNPPLAGSRSRYLSVCAYVKMRRPGAFEQGRKHIQRFDDVVAVEIVCCRILMCCRPPFHGPSVLGSVAIRVEIFRRRMMHDAGHCFTGRLPSAAYRAGGGGLMARLLLLPRILGTLLLEISWGPKRISKSRPCVASHCCATGGTRTQHKRSRHHG